LPLVRLFLRTKAKVNYSKGVSPNINHTQAAEIDVDLQTRLSRRYQIRLPYKFCANPFSGSRYISHTNKKVTDSAKNRTLRS